MKGLISRWAQRLVFCLAIVASALVGGQAFAQAPPAVELPDLGVSATDLVTTVGEEYAGYIGPMFGLGLAITLIWVAYRLTRRTVRGS